MTESAARFGQRFARLTKNDVEKLAETSVENRLILTRRLVEAYHFEGTPEPYRKVADDVFRVLAKDSAKDVRRTFSEMLQDSTMAPHDVIRRLASDEDDVAAPVLERSLILTEKDVMEIVAESAKSEAKLYALAGRPIVTKPVSLALADSGFCAVATRLAKNENADMGERAYRAMLERYHQEESAMAALLARPALPPAVAEMAARRVSESMLRQIGEHYPNLKKMAENLAKKPEAADDKKRAAQEYPIFIKKMQEMHVSEEIIGIIALALRKPELFEIFISQTLNVPTVNIRTLLADESDRGFYALYHRAKMPPHLYGATKLLRDAGSYIDAPQGGGLAIELSVSNRLIETMQLLVAESAEEIEHVDYIIALVRYARRLFSA